ncbi:peptidoglycan-binding domain-containing protein [Propionibacteriaceae bacterium Y2011]
MKAYQRAHGLVVDGKAGPNTMAKMGIWRAPGYGNSAIGGSIRRTEVIQRAAYWPNIGLGYSRSRYYRDLDNSKTYRTDCSGQVSNSWHATQSYSTRTLDNISSVISKSSLLPGDALNAYDYHTVIFCGWANSARTRYYSFEESGSVGAVGREVSGYPFYSDGRNWKPRRYHKIVWG